MRNYLEKTLFKWFQLLVFKELWLGVPLSDVWHLNCLERLKVKKKKKKSLPVFFFLLEKASYKALVSVSGLVLSPFPFFLCTAFRTKVKSYFERPLFNFPSLGGTILLGKHEEQSCLSALVLSLVDKLYSIVNNSAPGSDHELLTIL